MSLPLTRRIARAALLVAAGAAPLVGAAGTASAADLASTPNVAGGLTKLDGANANAVVDGATEKLGTKAGDTGVKTVKSQLPKAGKTVSGVGAAVPTVKKAAGDATGSSAPLLSGATKSAKGTLPGGAATQGLPLQGGLPLGG
ncbi:ATP-binding protein [Streptomyces sp. NPDC048639]|uniref:ATP-binding protein n=1 Tax=Streptomyces sp. NPDC048639 TaxID=3365581 RepID=UPI00371F31BA